MYEEEHVAQALWLLFGPRPELLDVTIAAVPSSMLISRESSARRALPASVCPRVLADSPHHTWLAGQQLWAAGWSEGEALFLQQSGAWPAPLTGLWNGLSVVRFTSMRCEASWCLRWSQQKFCLPMYCYSALHTWSTHVAAYAPHTVVIISHNI